MNLLYLTSNFPFPLMAGHLRYFHFMRELSARHSVTLLSLTGPDFRPEHVHALDGIAARVRTFPKGDGRGILGRLVKEDVRLFHAIEPAMRHLREAALAEAAAGRVDACVLCGKRVLPAARPLQGIPLVADVCDAESVRVEARMRHARRAELPRLALGWALLRSMERAVERRADRLLFASPRDRDAVVRPDDPRGVLLPNGVDAEYWKRRTPRRGRSSIVFPGAMHYRPNADAALRLAREVLPLVRREVPEAQLALVGRDPSLELLAVGREMGATVTGLVDDVRPFLEEATVFAAPLRYASGIQNKVLEAMAMELPVVASTAAAEGLFTEDGTAPPMEIADRTEEIAAVIIRSLKDEGRAPVAEARLFVERHFSWRTHALRLEAVLEEAIAERSTSRGAASAGVSP